MAVARLLTFPQDSSPDVSVLTLSAFANRPGGTTPWASNTVNCEDVRMPEGYLILNRINFNNLDSFDLRLMGRVDSNQPWAPILPAITEVAATGIAVSAAGVDWDNSPNIIGTLFGLATIAFPLVPQVRLEVHDYSENAAPFSFAMAAWLLTDV